MTPVDTYLARLRSELVAAGAADADDLVAEIRSLLADAAGDDPDGAAAAIARLGEPVELARGILAERGLDAAAGIASGVWWRLGIAAPIDIAVGLALPLAAAVPLYAIGALGEPRGAAVALALALGAVTLAWPAWVWRPYQRGGRTLSPGMTLTGLAVVRAPGFWRLVPLSELAEKGLAPRRRLLPAVLAALLAAVLLPAVALEGVGLGGSWAESAAMGARIPADRAELAKQLQAVTDGVYAGLAGSSTPESGIVLQHVAPAAVRSLASLKARLAERRIDTAAIDDPVRVAPGVYRVTVREYREVSEPQREQVGTSTLTIGRRIWVSPQGTSADWVVVGIEPGE